MYRNADGTIFPKSSALRLTTHRLTVESDGKEDSRSPRSPSSPSASTSRHNSFAMVAENGDNSFDGRTVSQDCSSPKGGGRHIQTRELAPSEKIGDAELRREVSDFIRFAKRGNISNGKKKNQLALEGPKEPSLSEVTSSVQGFAATTWHHIMRGMRTLVGIVFRHRKDSHFNTADLSTMWVNPSNAKDFEITPGCLQMRHKIGAGSYGVVYLVEHKVLAGRSSGPGADWWSYGIVLFALFEGTTPMHIYANRCKIDLRKLSLRSRFSVMKRVSVPISPLLHMDKRNLLKDFLREEPKVRLGVRRKQDFNLIKQHAYFANVNWRPMDEALDKILRRKYNLPMENEDEPVSRTKTI
ncbi:uncharacterized protein LOC111264912 isoform X1 [Varroa jacobsoni]|uniref:uncharacterized protein LOC111264912 isoform X1 n=1 Tax=Varroa jacobsoni TaxID=62625 RepID=UPI000BF39DB4|nr:uncharacterized protein LOC111264912 isoform X1 [Varroa jacobsoni]